MPTRAVAINAAVSAYYANTGLPASGVAANITTPRWVKDGVAAALANSTVTELDATNAPGAYSLQLNAVDTNCNLGRIIANCNATNCVVVGSEYGFYALPTSYALPATALDVTNSTNSVTNTVTNTGVALASGEDEKEFKQALRAKYNIPGELYFCKSTGNDANNGLLPSTAKVQPGTLAASTVAGDGICILAGTIAAGTAVLASANLPGRVLFGMGVGVSKLTTASPVDLVTLADGVRIYDLELENTYDGTWRCALASPAAGFKDVIVERVKCTGTADCLDLSGTECTGTFTDIEVHAQGDAVVVAPTTGSLRFIRPNFAVKWVSASSCVGHSALVADGGDVYLEDPVLSVSGSGNVVYPATIYAAGGRTVVKGGSITSVTTGTAAAKDIDINGGVLILDGTSYDPAKVLVNNVAGAPTHVEPGASILEDTAAIPLAITNSTNATALNITNSTNATALNVTNSQTVITALTNTIDTVVDSIKLKTDTLGAANVTVSSPLSATNVLTLIAAQDYNAADGTGISWTVTNYAGPNINGATGSLRFMARNTYESSATTVTLAVNTAAISQVNTTVTVNVELTAAQTLALSNAGANPPDDDYNFRYQVWATASNRSRCLVDDKATVLKRLPSA